MNLLTNKVMDRRANEGDYYQECSSNKEVLVIRNYNFSAQTYMRNVRCSVTSTIPV